MVEQKSVHKFVVGWVDMPEGAKVKNAASRTEYIGLCSEGKPFRDLPEEKRRSHKALGACGLSLSLSLSLSLCVCVRLSLSV
jgi:hypothetical protein